MGFVAIMRLKVQITVLLVWNRVTTGLIDHKINAKSNIVDFDAILSIVSVAADAE